MKDAQQDKNGCSETHAVLPLTDEKDSKLSSSSCESCKKKNYEISELKNKIAQIEKSLSKCRDELYRVYISRSWRYTWICRKLGSKSRTYFSILYLSVFRNAMKAIYLLLPIPIRYSNFVEKLKNHIKEKENRFYSSSARRGRGKI